MLNSSGAAISHGWELVNYHGYPYIYIYIYITYHTILLILYTILYIYIYYIILNYIILYYIILYHSGVPPVLAEVPRTGWPPVTWPSCQHGSSQSAMPNSHKSYTISWMRSVSYLICTFAIICYHLLIYSIYILLLLLLLLYIYSHNLW